MSDSQQRDSPDPIDNPSIRGEDSMTASSCALSGADHNEQGVALFRKGDHAGACASFTAALEQNPRLAEAYNNRGTVRQALGDMLGALADFGSALNLAPRYYDACCNRGIVRAAMGDHAGALFDFNTALVLKPQQAAIYLRRAAAQRALKQLPGAVADCNEAIRLNPNDSQAYHLRARLHNYRWNFPAAAADFDKALELYPRGPRDPVRLCRLHVGRASVYYHVGDEAVAWESYRAAYALHPQIYAQFCVSTVEENIRNCLADTLASYTKHLSANPADRLTWSLRGMTMLILGRKSEAWSDFEELSRRGRFEKLLAVLIDRVGDADDRARAQKLLDASSPSPSA
ncbi:MAG: tetratricopeptide repeat protein [Gemmataceae bacterium]|nr:tetratricopeptide repeat protein [Gemmataceae bacterium]